MSRSHDPSTNVGAGAGVPAGARRRDGRAPAPPSSTAGCRPRGGHGSPVGERSQPAVRCGIGIGIGTGIDIDIDIDIDIGCGADAGHLTRPNG